MAEEEPGQPSGKSPAPARKSDPKTRRTPEEIRAEEARKPVERMKIGPVGITGAGTRARA